MTAVGDARVAMATAITAAGAPATVDPAALPPVVIVDAARWREPRGVGGWAVDIPIRCVVAAPGDAAALAALESMVETVIATLGFAPADPAGWAPTPGAALLPSYTLTYARDVTNPNC